MTSEQITVAFLDVGQGDSTVIVLPDAATAVVIDCPESGKEATVSYLERHAIATLHVFISHADIDHIGGVADLVQQSPDVRQLIFNLPNPEMPTETSEQKVLRRYGLVLRHIGQLMERRGIRGVRPSVGKEVDADLQGLAVDILHPDDSDILMAGPTLDRNNLSTVLRVTFAGKRILLTGDVQGRGWAAIVHRKTDLRADVLKFPHHGAWIPDNSSQPSLADILALIAPSLVILSLGSHNTHNHPRPETLELLRRRTKLRIMCTEATSKCHPALTHTSVKLPCAGTVEIVISSAGMNTTPSKSNHAKVIESLDDPQCKRKRRIRIVRKPVAVISSRS